MITELLNLNLIKELNLDALPEEQRKELVNQMTEVLNSRIDLEILSILNEQQKKELDNILDSDGDMLTFLKNAIPNFDILIAETVANFKKEMLEMKGPSLAQ